MRIKPSNESLNELYQRLVSMNVVIDTVDSPTQPMADLNIRQFFPALIPLYRTIYADSNTSCKEDDFERTKIIYDSFSYMHKQSGIDVLPNDYSVIFPALIKIWVSPNLDDNVIFLIKDFIKTPGIKKIIPRLANESRDKTSGTAGELYHASELAKRGYRIVSFGFTASYLNENILESDLLVEKNGIYYMVEVKNYSYRTINSKDLIEENFLEIEEGKSKKLERYEKFIEILQQSESTSRTKLIQSLKDQIPEDDLNKLIEQLISNRSTVLFSYPRTLGLHLNRTNDGLKLENNNDINLLEVEHGEQDLIIQKMENGIREMDVLLRSHSTSDIEISSETVSFSPLNNTSLFQVSAQRADLFLGQNISNLAKLLADPCGMAFAEILCNLVNLPSPSEYFSFDAIKNIEYPPTEVMERFTLPEILASSEDELIEVARRQYDLVRKKFNAEFPSLSVTLPDFSEENARIGYRIMKTMAQEMANSRTHEEYYVQLRSQDAAQT